MNTRSLIKGLRINRWLLSGFLLLALTGCESMRTVMTQHEVKMEVTSEPIYEGNYFLESSAPAFPFDHPGYEDENIRLFVRTSLWGLSFQIESKQATYTVLRLDQAQLGVSGEQLQPLQIHMLSVGYRTLQDVREMEFSVQPIAFRLSDSEEKVRFTPDYSIIFDTPYIFGTQPLEQGQGFIDDGVGRSMVLVLPIEYDGERVTYQFTFTATDVKQWNSYH